MTTCAACLKPADPEANFCSRCGQRLTETAAPRGDRRVVTVLFADVSGFTAMSEKLDPEAVAEIVNQCFQALTTPIYRYGGVVDKYIGDAIMALFGAPIAHEDDPERALLAALAMQAAARAFAQELMARTGLSLKLRIGLNTGLVVAGEMGGDQKRDYTVMGDTVNLAQRMEAAARPDSILVTHETYRLTAHRFGFKALSPLLVKGKSQPVQAYEVIGAPEAGPGRVLPNRTIGREREVASLMDAWVRVQEGQPHWVTLMGEAGIGKTQIVDEFLRRLPQEVRVTSLRGASYQQDRAFELAAQWLHAWTGVPRHQDPHAVFAALQQRLADIGWPDPEEADLISLLLGIDRPALKGASDAQRIQAAIASSLQALLTGARHVPSVLVIEDVHWADPSSFRWLEALAEMLAGERVPLLIVAQARPGARLPEASAPAGLDRTLTTIRPLSDPDSRRLVEILYSQGPQPEDEVLDLLVRRSEGNPMVLRELVRGQLEGAAEVLTPSLKGLVASRLDRLLPSERDFIELAAVMGRSFDAELIASLLGEPDPHALLLSLGERELIRPSEPDGHAFSQAIVHEVVYDGILLRKRRELHRQVAETLEQAMGGHAGLAPDLARHFLIAEAPERALGYLLQSAERARLTYATQEAIHLWQTALEILATHADLTGLASGPDIRLKLAMALSMAGDYPGALAQLDQALKDPDSHLTIELLRAKGIVYERRGDFVAALASYESAERLGPSDSVLGVLWVDRAWLKIRSGELASAEELCRRAQSMLSDGLERARAHSISGIAAYRANRWQEARIEHREALELREGSGHLPGIASSLNNLGMVEAELGEWDEAFTHYERSLALYQRMGDRGYVATVQNNLGDLCARRGDLRAAERYHRDALQARRNLGDRFGIAASLCALGETLRQRGELEQARSALREGLLELQALGEAELVAEACEALGQVELAARAYPEAQRWLQQAMQEAKRLGDTLRQASVARAQAQMALEVGDLAQTRAWLDRSASLLADLSPPLEQARHLALEARLLRAEGQAEAAEACAARADALLGMLGVRQERASLLWSPQEPPIR
ncbi:MAG TPA: adenylate/guanylate cyclase domain-containing protein [Stenomitos sp.]